MEVASEAGLHWASVRFAGQIREPQATKAEAFEEIWHLQKPVSGDSGWVLAGIQQVS
jgi:predicted lipid-binding transport protein (Tim44 family)